MRSRYTLRKNDEDPVEDARRIRRLAARDLEPEAIADLLKLRPAVVRRVLARSAQRGAPRKRASSTTLSFATTPDIANAIRLAAAARGTSVSTVLEEFVRKALPQIPSAGASLTQARAPSKAASAAPLRRVSTKDPALRMARTVRARVPATRSGRPAQATRSGGKPVLATAADAPESVRKLLKSYELKELRWSVRGHRYEIVVAVLTRGNDRAKRWLRGVLPLSEVRALVRKYRGAGCAEPDRALLRKQLNLTEGEVPPRPYVGFAMEQPDENERP
jgi:predicted HicB family RNase H-like nuclease